MSLRIQSNPISDRDDIFVVTDCNTIMLCLCLPIGRQYKTSSSRKKTRALSLNFEEKGPKKAGKPKGKMTNAEICTTMPMSDSTGLKSEMEIVIPNSRSHRLIDWSRITIFYLP